MTLAVVMVTSISMADKLYRVTSSLLTGPLDTIVFLGGAVEVPHEIAAFLANPQVGVRCTEARVVIPVNIKNRDTCSILYWGGATMNCIPDAVAEQIRDAFNGLG